MPPRSSVFEGLAPRLGCAGLIFAFALGSLYYWVVMQTRGRQTAALFIGLPTFLALVLVFTPRAKTATGTVVKGITLCLLLAHILLWEGFVCILMSAPLFYLVGLAVGIPIDIARRRNRETLGLLPILPLLLMSLEGVTPELSFPRQESLTVSRIVAATPLEVEQRLGDPWRLDSPLPVPLRVGFPRPVEVKGAGLRPGDSRVVSMSPGGSVVFVVTQRDENRIVFKAASDSTPVSKWLTWVGAEIRLEPRGPSSTAIHWQVSFLRKLDPAWYFGPWERYMVARAVDHMISSVAEGDGWPTRR